ncbi:MAG: J domain-containing protein [unclassified Hahellaceae]|nr:J domain-containing protein [Hahellaceae bacterium]|tara:strand:- start:9412 stop:9984 length:573 start_codon:yes stop_codon:yes gene_type:complete
MTAEAYPLHWPDGWPRCSSPDYARFKITPGRARDELFQELERLGAEHIVLSTNIELRLDGLPYANRRPPQDEGVAVYFQYQGQAMVFACDRWKGVHNNIQAVRKTIEALRGIERWGASDMLQRAFAGFEALPDFSERSWWLVLGVSRTDSPEAVRTAYQTLRSRHHPDRGGDPEDFRQIQRAWQTYQEHS